MAKFYQRTQEINGVTYTAQFNGLSAWQECIDDSYIPGTDTMSNARYAKNVLKRGLLEPSGLTPDDFDTEEELTEVVRFVADVMRGRFRNAEDPQAAPAKSKR
nr:hypothetical protein [uncultured Stomatobaculum sp.]